MLSTGGNKMKITQEDIDNFKKLEEKISERADEIITIYKKVRDEVFDGGYIKRDKGIPTELYSLNFVRFSHLDAQEIVYSGEELLEFHTVRLPIWCLTSSDVETTIKLMCEKQKANYQEKKEVEARLSEERERALLESLKSKYEAKNIKHTS
jgi:hypothetical protein